MLNYNLVTNTHQLDMMIGGIMSGDKIIQVDTETTGLSAKKDKLRLIQLNDGKQTYIVDCFKFDSYKQLEKLGKVFEDSTVKKIFHNAKFDLQFLLEHLGCRVNTLFDIFIACKLLDFVGKKKGYYKLSSIAKRYLDVDISKVEQNSDWSGDLSKSQLEYAATDVIHLAPLREIFINKLTETSQLRAAKLEFDFIPCIAEMEMVGFGVHRERFVELMNKNLSVMLEKEAALLNFLQTRGGTREAPKKIYQENIFGEIINVATSNDINVRSAAQVKKIYQEMGVPITTTDQKFIGPMVVDYPELQTLIDFRDIDKLCGTYGRKLYELIQDDDRIYANFNQLGAVTSRMSSDKPNLQNQPRTFEFRNCYGPKPGRKLIVNDFSQIEIRILGDFSNDQVIIDTYNSGKDIHSLTASKVFNLPYDDIKSKYKEQRQASKTTNFSVIYGISAPALMLRLKNEGVEADVDYCQNLIDGFYGTYKTAARWLFEQEKKVLYNPELRTAAGNLIKLVFDRNDQKKVGKAKRDARNYPIQGTSGNITKLAATNVHKRLVNEYKDAYVVNIIHDEIIVEANESDAENIKHMMEKEMADAGNFFLKKIKVEAEGKVADSWAEK